MTELPEVKPLLAALPPELFDMHRDPIVSLSPNGKLVGIAHHAGTIPALYEIPGFRRVRAEAEGTGIGHFVGGIDDRGDALNPLSDRNLFVFKAGLQGLEPAKHIYAGVPTVHWPRGVGRDGFGIIRPPNKGLTTEPLDLVIAEEMFSGNSTIPDIDVRIQTMTFAEPVRVLDALPGHLFVQVGATPTLIHFQRRADATFDYRAPPSVVPLKEPVSTP